ncbi:hypothetical protein INR49_024667 [Caranx melampygus]|nr:hypothetical protein INR49_024667 [Caranx melampygus]
MKASSNGEDGDDDDDDDDDDFDEVPEKEGYEPHIPEHLRSEYGLDPSPSISAAPVTNNPPAKRPAAPLPQPSSCSSSRHMKRLTEEEQDPTCAAATLRVLKQNLSLPAVSSSSSSSTGPSTSRSTSDQTSVDAPVVPFGLDLYYWGQEQPNAGKIIKAASQHQFWVPCEVEEEVQNEQLLAESKSRYISFPGSFIPVSHHCRAPLGNGKLCQRQDRLKCPFHGPIIPRDQEDWRDAELMRDIEAATGENLGSDRVRKKGKGKKKKFPNLSDLKQSSNTSRSRLEKKVFNKSTMRRVAQVCAVEGGGSIALCPQHEGGQDVASCEERQLDQAASGGVVVPGVASMHGQVPADWRGGTERAEAPQTSCSSTCAPCTPSSCTSGGRGVSTRVLFLPLGPAVLEPDLDLGLSEGKAELLSSLLYGPSGVSDSGVPGLW